MVRVKKGKAARKHRKHLLEYTKGFRWHRKSKFRAAKEAIMHAWKHAYRDRKVKKRDFRGLWQIQIGAACKELGISYGKFIHNLKQKNILIDRKILSQLAQKFPEIFKKIVEETKK